MLMRKCGYGETSNKDGVTSYVRIFGSGGYPRFHCYIDTMEYSYQINLHIDQKKPTYGEGTAHSGEYESQVVEREAARMYGIIDALAL